MLPSEASCRNGAPDSTPALNPGTDVAKFKDIWNFVVVNGVGAGRQAARLPSAAEHGDMYLRGPTNGQGAGDGYAGSSQALPEEGALCLM